jgi:SRSO17 transposase
MVAERWDEDEDDVAIVRGGAAALDRLHERIAHRFGRAEVRARVRRYVRGLLARVERKNGWQLAEAIGEAGPQGVQRLLNAARWDADAVRNDLRAYVVEHLGDAASGVLIVDETSFLKKGARSCGVAPQYAGSVGHSANAQVGVFLSYASAKGHAFIDRALYLPRGWTNDRARCTRAGVPAGVTFATKAELAKRMLARAFTAAVPAGWVVADSFYGRAHQFRRWLEAEERPHVVGVLPAQVVVHGGRRQRAQALAASLAASAWVRRSSGLGSQGERVHAWACVALSEDAPAGWRRWLLVRRALDTPSEAAYYRAFGPADTPAGELVRVAGLRWAVEEGFGQAKGEVGLDHYEVRRWDAWHRHITLCLLAHAALAVMSAQARCPGAADQEGGAVPRAVASSR